MGVAESKVLARDVLAACERAENEGNSKLDDEALWRNQDTLKAVKNIYKYLPKDIRSGPRQSTIKKAIARSKQRLNVPQVIQKLEDKREDLFPGRSSNHDLLSTTFPPQTNPLAGYYSRVIFYEDRTTLDTVRLRFLYVALHRVKQKVQPGRQYEYYDATFIAQVIFESGCTDDHLVVIENKVRTWIGLGERYNSIANDLGGLGVLYILPDLGGESVWSKELPISPTNENRISMIQNLKDQGITEEARRRNPSAEYEVLQIFNPLLEGLERVSTQRLSETHRIGRSQSPLQNNPRPREMPLSTLCDSHPLEPRQPIVRDSTRNQSSCTLSHLTAQDEGDTNDGGSLASLNLQSYILKPPGYDDQRVFRDNLEDGSNLQINIQPYAVPREASQLDRRRIDLETEAFNLQPFIQAPLHVSQGDPGQQFYPPPAVTAGESEFNQLSLDPGSGIFNLQPFIQQPPLHGSQEDIGQQFYAPGMVTLGGHQFSQLTSNSETGNSDAGIFDLQPFIQQPLTDDPQGGFGHQSYARGAVTAGTNQAGQQFCDPHATASSPQFFTQQLQSQATPDHQQYVHPTMRPGVGQLVQRSSNLDAERFGFHQQLTGHVLQSISVQ